MHDRIRIMSWDRRRLRSLLAAQRGTGRHDRRSLDRLQQALESAIVAGPPSIPPTTITMHGTFRVIDLDTREKRRREGPRGSGSSRSSTSPRPWGISSAEGRRAHLAAGRLWTGSGSLR